MSDTSNLPGADSEGVPAEDRPERFTGSDSDADRDGRTDPGDATGESGAEADAAEAPPAEFDPAKNPSNPDLVKNTEPPD